MRLAFLALLALAACSKNAPPAPAAQDAAPPPPPPKPLTWCETQSPRARFCEDFDAESGFDLTRVLTAQGDAKIVDSTRSQPKALSLSTSSNDAGEGSRASLLGNFGLDHAVSDVTYAFALRVGKIEASRAAPLLISDLSVGSYAIALSLDGAGANATEVVMGTPQTRITPLSRGPGKGAWVRVRIHLVPAGAVQVFLDADKVLDLKPLVGSPNVRQVGFAFGARQEAAPSANEIAFDDVTVDAK